MLVGEQPGDQEDLAGHPFVGPAGRELDQALEGAGLDRNKVYITNVVKHFKNEPRGKRRLHKRPDRYEVERCRWWLDQEIAAVQPQLILALGVTAANLLTGKSVVLSRMHGQVLELTDGRRAMVTTHPSSILRMPDQPSRHKARAALVEDIKAAVKAAAG
jgi:DNA polymerase